MAAELKEGDRIGRYIVIRRVGSGSRGVVHAAYDPELGRKVAVKLLRSSAEQAENRARLLREAKAMARLAHPNLVTVHDVGAIDDQVFVAMELIDGATLTAWLAEAPRRWRQVLEVFLAAGEGLAAVHAAGLVHRDFNPDNVLLAEDGRVVVMDFGLARAVAGRHSVYPTEMRADASHPEAEPTWLGTPAYMAPEQLRGETIDSSADQFSFCVALHEGLYGERPFAGEDWGERIANIEASRARPPSKAARVPSWVRRALLQGLSFDPQDRYRDMRALLDVLGRDPTRRWRALATIAVPLAALGVGSLAIGRTAAAPNDYCDDLSAHFDGIWDDATQREIEAAFEATATPYALDAWATVRDRGDAYVHAWLQAQGNACRDQYDTSQSPGALAMRMACLQEQLSRVGAITEFLGQADATTVLRASEAVAQLPSPGECENVGQVAAQARARGRLVVGDRRRLDELLARGAAAFHSSAYPEADRVVREALDEARRVGDRWAEAEALALVAMVSEFGDEQREAESRYHEALSAALAIGHHACAADITLGLIRLADGKDAVEHAERWARHGQATLQALGGDARREAHFGLALGGVYLEHARYNLADEQLKHVITLGEEAGPSARTLVAAALANLGGLAAHHGRFEEAAQKFEQAHLVLEEELGPAHPTVASMLINLGGAYGELGDLQRARELYEQALRILQATLGPEHPSLAVSHRVLAWVLQGLDQPAEALVHADQALKIATASHGDRHDQVARSLGIRSGILVALEREAEAIESAERALEIARDLFDEAHPTVALYEVELGVVLAKANRPDQAKEHVTRGLALREKAFGPDDSEVGRAAQILAEIELDGLQRPDRALPHAERGLALIGEPDDGNHHRIGEAAFMLARVWSATKRTDARARARAFAQQASAAYERAGDAWLAARDEVDAWARANL